jgi:hypothetical protein
VERTCASAHLDWRYSKPGDLTVLGYSIAAGHSLFVLHAGQPLHSARLPREAHQPVYPGVAVRTARGQSGVGGLEISQITPHAEPRGWLTRAAWNLLHPITLAFEGVAWLSLLTGALAAAYKWWNETPDWGLILGFALLWILGAMATYCLHRSFNRSSGT